MNESRQTIICVMHKSEEGFQGKMKPIGKCFACDKLVYIAERPIAGEISAEQIKKLPVTPKFIGRECMMFLVTYFIKLMAVDPNMRELLKRHLLKKEFDIFSEVIE